MSIEFEPVPEYKVNIDPYEKLALDLLDNIKQDWDANKVINWVTARLVRISMDREAREIANAYMITREVEGTDDSLGC